MLNELLCHGPDTGADAPAYRCGEQTLTRKELLAYAKALASALSGESTPVVLYGHKEPLMLISLLACILAGRPYVPCDCAIPDSRLREMIAASGAKQMLCAREKQILGITCIQPDTLMKIITQSAAGDIPPQAPPHRDCYIAFTSGSTGRPKGVRVSRKNAESFLRWFSALPAIRETKPRVVLNQAALSFDLSVADLYYSLASGAQWVALPTESRHDFARLFNALRESGAELAVMTPSFAELCLCDRAFCQSLLPKLKVIFFCGEVLRPQTAKRLFERFEGIRILNAYGPTEATCAVCAAEITEEMAQRPFLPIGALDLSSAEIRLCDRRGRPVRDGECGEIILLGDCVASGYCGGTPGGFEEQGGQSCYRTGDIGYKKGDWLYFTGRMDTQIKYKGYRIELSDIENSLCRIAGVLRAAVCPHTDPGGRVTALTAYIHAEGVTAEEIRFAASRILPDYMVPKHFVLTEHIPLSAHGKIDRRKVAQYVYENYHAPAAQPAR